MPQSRSKLEPSYGSTDNRLAVIFVAVRTDAATCTHAHAHYVPQRKKQQETKDRDDRFDAAMQKHMQRIEVSDDGLCQPQAAGPSHISNASKHSSTTLHKTMAQHSTSSTCQSYTPAQLSSPYQPDLWLINGADASAGSNLLHQRVAPTHMST
jgi:hypothetical protein